MAGKPDSGPSRVHPAEQGVKELLREPLGAVQALEHAAAEGLREPQRAFAHRRRHRTRLAAVTVPTSLHIPLLPFAAQELGELFLDRCLDPLPQPAANLLENVLPEPNRFIPGRGNFLHGVTLCPRCEDPVCSTGGYAAFLFPQNSGRIP